MNSDEMRKRLLAEYSAAWVDGRAAAGWPACKEKPGQDGEQGDAVMTRKLRKVRP